MASSGGRARQRSGDGGPPGAGFPADGWFTLEGLRLHYTEWGAAASTPLVLLHGLQDCARSWDRFASSMCQEYRVIALDHRGHGDSDWAGPSAYRLQDYVADVEGLLDHLSLGEAYLAGHSAGGRNAFVYSTKHPERVKALVVVDIDPDAFNPESRRMFERYLSEGDEWESTSAVVERLRTRQPNASEEMLQQQAFHMTSPLSGGRRRWKRDPALLTSYERPDLWREWGALACPTLVMRGRQSGLLTHEVAVRMKEALPGARLVELEGGGHWFYQEAPSAFEAAVRWFMDGLNGPMPPPPIESPRSR